MLGDRVLETSVLKRVGVFDPRVLDEASIGEALLRYDEIAVAHLAVRPWGRVGDADMQHWYEYIASQEWGSVHPLEAEETAAHLDEQLERWWHSPNTAGNFLGLNFADFACGMYCRLAAAAVRSSSASRQAIPVMPTLHAAACSFCPPSAADECLGIVTDRIAVPNEVIPIADIRAFRSDTDVLSTRTSFFAWEHSVLKGNMAVGLLNDELAAQQNAYNSCLRKLTRNIRFVTIASIVRPDPRCTNSLLSRSAEVELGQNWSAGRMSVQLTNDEQVTGHEVLAEISDAYGGDQWSWRTPSSPLTNFVAAMRGLKVITRDDES